MNIPALPKRWVRLSGFLTFFILQCALLTEQARAQSISRPDRQRLVSDHRLGLSGTTPDRLTKGYAATPKRGLAALPASAKPLTGTIATAVRQRVDKTLTREKALLNFEQNKGQLSTKEALYRAQDAQATYFFTRSEIRSVVSSAKDSTQTAYALQFVNPNADVAVTATHQVGSNRGAINYISSEGSFADVARYGQLHYTNLWTGVQADFYEADGGSLKYDFVVQPQADPAQVRFRLDGATNLKVNAKGELEFTTPFGTLQKGKPYSYQRVNGKDVEVKTEYVVKNGEVSFKIGTYDPALPLIIDPIALKWCTYLTAGIGNIWDMFVDNATGRIYLVGNTTSAVYPNTLGRPYGGGQEAFVTCMERDGTSLVWSTYIGGSGSDDATAISVDAAGDVYVEGRTSSTNFPVNGTVGAYNAFNSGSQDIVLFRLNSTGTTLKYSTYLGGTGFDGNTICKGLVVDNGTVYFGSSTSSTNFPTTAGAFQPSSSNTNLNALYCAINTNVAGSAGLKYSTYVAHTGNSKYTSMGAVAEDKDGNIWFVGWGNQGDLPMPANAIQKSGDFLLGSNNYTELVFKFSKAGQYLYGSYVNPFWTANGGGTSWSVQNIAIDADGNVYVTASVNYTAPTAAALVTSPAITTINELTPLSSCFNAGTYEFGTVVKIPYSLTPNFEFVSVFPMNNAGGNNDPQLAVDKKGNIHVVTPGGGTRSFVYPFTQGALSTYLKPTSYNAQYYVLSPSGGSVLYGTTISRVGSGLRSLMISVNDKCEAYIAHGGGFITPSYRDQETNSQKFVYNATGGSNYSLSVFHEPKPNNNTITEFVPGNNTFCVNGAIYQNPNDGPILGSTPTYQSGDGSSPLHNLPNFLNGPVLTAHPTLGAIQYQWQKSRDGGATWTDVGNGTFDVYKPEPEATAGTVQYRRQVMDICGSAVDVSNVAHATIAGNFNLQVTSPTKPIYYCPAVAGTDLGTSITGASGNISWQWYDGYSPLTGNGTISPSSGSGSAAGFTAQIGTSVTVAGIYRLVVTDAGGCKKEAFVSIVPKTASPGTAPSIQLCPGGVTSVKLGPPAINPDFIYSWSGPGGFTSSLPNPVVTAAGTYTLQVKLTTDAGFCAPGTGITINAATPHAAILVPMPDKGFCQPDTPAGIGLSGTAPAGYVFQWAPGSFIDNQQAFNPIFDPGFVPENGFPIGTVNYTFTALRLSDGCIYEDQITVTDTARALAQAGDDKPAFCATSQVFGAPETTGSYFQWRAVGTTFPGGIAALTADPAFLMDGVATNLGTKKYLTGGFPSGTACYTIDYEIRGAYVPFPTNCFTKDTVRLFVCPCSGGGGGGGGGGWCTELTASALGTQGACSGTVNWIGAGSVAGINYTWETESVDGVIQTGANRAPKGLFFRNTNGSKGAALPTGGAHPAKAIADFDDASWGWPGANVVIYKLTSSQNYGAGTIDCPRFIQVFSSRNSTPVVGVKDKVLCLIPAPGVKFGSSGSTTPYAVSGSDYTQAPNSAFLWSWSGGSITSDAATPFPTINPSVGTTPYYVTVRDTVTGCVAKDTLVAKVNRVVTNAGADLSNICPGTLVQLGTATVSGLTYSWSPSGGLNFPIGTPNSTVAQPYLTVPGSPVPPAALTYTVTVTDPESGCQATDAMIVNTTSTPPPAIAAATYVACPNAVLTIGPGGSLTGATYTWTVQSGSANLSWLSATDVRQPVATLPAGFTGPAVFRLTVTKGTCGSVFADYTINDLPVLPSLGGPYTADCNNPLIQLGSAAVAGYTYQWYPATGLYTDAAGTTPYVEDANLAQPYARPTASTTYTLLRTGSFGCSQTATVVVDPPAGSSVAAGPDLTWCPGSSAVTLNGAGTGTLTWTAIGYSANPNAATPTAIASPMTDVQMLGYLSSTSTAITTFNQSAVVVGQYVYRLTSTNGACSISDDIVIKVPNLPSGIAGISQNLCLGSSLPLGDTENPTTLNYVWTALNPSNAGNTISDPTAARPFVTPTVNTTYQVVFTDAATGCSAKEVVSVVINPKPVIADVNLPAVCAPINAVDLTAQISGYNTLVNPVWYRGLLPGGSVVSTPASVTPTKTTTYYLVAESDFGCRDTAQVVVNVGSTVTPDIAPSADINCTTYSFDLASVQGPPSQVGNTLEWHSANNTNAATLLTNAVVTKPGTYYLFEKAPSPANCYSASDSITISTTCPLGSIGDYVWKDANRNGKQDAGETGVNGVKVILWSATAAGVPVAKLDSATTAGAGANAGKYLFSNLPKGDYVVQFVKSTIPVECSDFTAKDTTAAGTTDKNDSDADKTTGITGKVMLDPKVLSGTSTPTDSLATNNLTVDAGLVAPLGSIGDLIWKDLNDNGLQDLPTEKGVAGVKVNLYAAAGGTKTGAVLQTKTTDAAGLYLFTGLLSGDYIVEIDKTTLKDTCAITSKKDVPGDDTKDSDFNPTTGLSQVVTLNPVFNPTTAAEILATNNLTVDAGLVKVCITPTRLVQATDPTCAVAGKLELSSTNGDKYGISKGNTYTSPAYPTATAVSTLPIAIKSNISHLADSSWTIRVFNKDNTCFKDTTVTVKALVKDATISVNNGFPACRQNGTAYSIKFTKSPNGAIVTAKNIATGAAIAVTGDSVANIPLSVAAVRLIVTNGVCKDSVDVTAPVCNKPVGSIGDLIWKDLNDNGLQDLPTEKGVAGVKVNLYAAAGGTKTGAVLQTKTTDAAGLYLFTGLLSGDYIVEIDKTTLKDTCAITGKQNIPSDDTKDSDFNPTTGLSQVVTLNPVFNPTTAAEIPATDNLTVDAGLVVPCVKSNVTLIGAPVCSADVKTYSLTFSVSNKVGRIKVDKGILTGSNPYSVTGITSGASVKITDSLSAVCKFDTLITGPNCNCNPALPRLAAPSLTACIGDTFPTLKATVVGLATVEWFTTATSTAVLFTGLNYKPSGSLTAAGAAFYAQARSTDPSCPAAVSSSRVMATINAQDCTKQVDLALKKSINKKIAQIGDVLTYTLKVWNESNTNATSVEVTDSIAATVQFQTGSFTASRGSASITGNVINWIIGGIAANGDTVTLTYKVKATLEGIHFNTAEISKVNEKDVDSTPANGKEEEDDIERQCFTVPVKLCAGEKAEVNVPAKYTNVQWFKNGGSTPIGTGNTLLLSEIGTYTFTATNQACPASGCCPIIIEPGINCCPEELCIPFTIKQTKKGKR